MGRTVKWLITGRNGQLGRCITTLLSADRGAEVVALSREDLDIANQGQVERVLDDVAPNVLVNAAAYTAVDAAEDDEDSASLINAVGPGFLADACGQRGIRLVHVSTDYVFDGIASTPYLEGTAPDPQGAYGRTKLAGERAVLSAAPDALIVRTAWVFSEHGHNFLKTMLRLADREELRVVDDQKGGPTDALSLAHAICRGLDQGLTGIAHYTDGPACTWADFAEEIFSVAYELGLIKRRPTVRRISSKEFPSKVARPAYSVLANNRIDYHGDWRAGTRRVLEALAAG